MPLIYVNLQINASEPVKTFEKQSALRQVSCICEQCYLKTQQLMVEQDVLEHNGGQHSCRSLVVLFWSFVTVCVCLSEMSISDSF